MFCAVTNNELVTNVTNKSALSVSGTLYFIFAFVFIVFLVYVDLTIFV